MATQVQFRRGTTAQNSTFTGAVGEITVDTDKDTLLLHDGGTAGGFEIVNVSTAQTLSNKTLSNPVVTGNLTVDTNTLYVDSTNNRVGIGTASPSITLDIDSASSTIAKFTRSSISSVIYNSTGSGTSYFADSTLANSFGVNVSGDYVSATTNGSERIRIDSSGNVGIGKSSPSAKLHIATGASAGTTQEMIELQSLSGVDNVNLRIGGTPYTGATQAHIDFNINAGTNFQSFMTFGTSAGAGTTERMRITSGGEVYIAGTTDQGAYNLQCNGTGVWGAGAYVNGSDERIKENIVSLDSGLDVVAKLNPVTYTYKQEWSKDQSTQTGFIAQELLTALDGKNYVDGIVQQDGEYMSVAYQNIIPILTKAIQEQQDIIKALETRIQTLENQ